MLATSVSVRLNSCLNTMPSLLFTVKPVLSSVVIVFTLLNVLLSSNTLPVVTKLVLGVTVLEQLSVPPKNMLPSFKLGVSLLLPAP